MTLTSPGAIIDVAWRILWLKNDVFDEILGCVGHLTSPEKKWAPVAIKIFYKYASLSPLPGEGSSSLSPLPPPCLPGVLRNHRGGTPLVVLAVPGSKMFEGSMPSILIWPNDMTRKS